jgi:long-chain acyl-CoA synthetase
MDQRTLCDIFYHSTATFRKPDALRYKKDGAWRDISSEELRRAVEELSMGLRALGLERGERVSILSENRPEWVYADLATLCAGAVDAPIYPSLPPAQVLYILNDCQAKAVFVSSETQAAKVAEIRAQAPWLKHVIRMDDGAGQGTLAISEVRERGRAALAADRGAVKARADEVKPGDLATLIYTSGTTGEPKGVMLTHDNIVSNVAASLSIVSDFGPADTALSFLPQCHIFERMGGYYLMLAKGVTIAFAESIEKVPANMGEVRPTLMFSTPRLYEKMHARVLEKVAGDPPARQRIFWWAVGVGARAFAHRVAGTRPGPLLAVQKAVADKLVFAKIRERVGGRLRLFVSGGAPLARDINEFFGAAGLLILEGYGLTETSPVICVNTPEAPRPGTVGRPIPGVEVKIAKDGEILTRGRHVMKGYFNKPEATREAIDEDGWFHTGDIGHLDADGYLSITDRKKDIIVTSGGKNISPQPIENLVKSSPLVSEVVMIGNRRHFPAALIVPAYEAMERWAREKGLAGSREELVRNPEVVAHYEKIVEDLTAGLAQFERIKKIALVPQDFSQAAGELTPTLKVKRRVVEEHYKGMIDRMYAESAPA